jgi:ribosomal-protein-alanine N-acetyltransferase
MPAIPAILETNRLVLRPFTLDDVDAMFILGSDPEIVRYVGNTPFTSLDLARDYLVAHPLRDYQVYGYGRFACVLKETGAVIGFCGVKHIPELLEDELGYRFLPAYWGQGLAKEAARAVIDHARDSLAMSRLISLIHPENSASRNVVVKFGFAYEKNVDVGFVADSHLELYASTLL